MKFIVIFGPPAVGKMTVGYELAKLTGFRLFHNHMTIELVLNFFDYEQPQFHTLVAEFRKRIFEEVAASDLTGLIFILSGRSNSNRSEHILSAVVTYLERKAQTYIS